MECVWKRPLFRRPTPRILGPQGSTRTTSPSPGYPSIDRTTALSQQTSIESTATPQPHSASIRCWNEPIPTHASASSMSIPVWSWMPLRWCSFQPWIPYWTANTMETDHFRFHPHRWSCNCQTWISEVQKSSSYAWRAESMIEKLRLSKKKSKSKIKKSIFNFERKEFLLLEGLQ